MQRIHRESVTAQAFGTLSGPSELKRNAAELQLGRAITIVPRDHHLTTQEAAGTNSTAGCWGSIASD